MISSYFPPWVSHMTPVRVREGGSKHFNENHMEGGESCDQAERGEREGPTWTTETHEEEQESSCRKRSEPPGPEPKVRPGSRGYTTTRTRIRTTDQEQPSPPCQSPSGEKAPADSSCRTSSGERTKILLTYYNVYLFTCTCRIKLVYSVMIRYCHYSKVFYFIILLLFYFYSLVFTPNPAAHEIFK